MWPDLDLESEEDAKATTEDWHTGLREELKHGKHTHIYSLLFPPSALTSLQESTCVQIAQIEPCKKKKKKKCHLSYVRPIEVMSISIFTADVVLSSKSFSQRMNVTEIQ